MDRLRPAGRAWSSRRRRWLRAGAYPRPRTSSPSTQRFLRLRRAASPSRARTTRSRHPRLPRLRRRTSSAGSSARAASGTAERPIRARVARGRAPRVRRDAAARPTPSASSSRHGRRAAVAAARSRWSSPAWTSTTRPRPTDHRWQASPQAGSSGSCARRRSRSACSSTATHLRLVYAPRGETSGLPDLPRRRQWPRWRAGRSSRRSTCCSRAERLFTLPRQAAPARAPRRQPQVPERGLDQARRAGAGRALRAAPRLPGGRRRSDRASCSATCCASDPNQVYAGLLTVLLRLVFLLYAEERGAPLERRGLPAATTRSPASSSGCARTPAAIPTRWTSATAPGRSSWRSSG